MGDIRNAHYELETYLSTGITQVTATVAVISSVSEMKPVVQQIIVTDLVDQVVTLSYGANKTKLGPALRPSEEFQTVQLTDLDWNSAAAGDGIFMHVANGEATQSLDVEIKYNMIREGLRSQMAV